MAKPMKNGGVKALAALRLAALAGQRSAAIPYSALPSSDTDALRTEFNRMELSRDDT